VDTPVQQQVQHWPRIMQEADMNPLIVDSATKPVNPVLGTLDENFEWDASKKLHGSNDAPVRQRLSQSPVAPGAFYLHQVQGQLSCCDF
jgi:hypothetical protein